MIVTARVEIAKGEDQRRDAVFVPMQNVQLFAAFDVPNDDFGVITSWEEQIIFWNYLINPSFVAVVDFLLFWIFIEVIEPSDNRICSSYEEIFLWQMNASNGLLGANEGILNLIASHVNCSDILIPGADV